MKKSVLLLILLIGCAGRSVEFPSWGVSSSNVVVPSVVSDDFGVVVGSFDFVWGKVYVFDDSGVWREFGSNVWFEKNASFSVDISSNFSSGKDYMLLSYACNRVGSGWDCNGGKWMVSSFRVVDDFVVFYGPNRDSELSVFDFSIVDASTRTPSADSVCYLSVGEFPVSCVSSACVGSKFFVDGVALKNPVWGSFIADVSSPSWRSYLVDEAKALVASGCGGIFLDTVDSVEFLPPDKRSGILDIVRDISDVSSFVVLNRGSVYVNGVSVAVQLKDVVDVVLIESFSSTFILVDGVPVYSKVSPEGLAWLDSFANSLKSAGVNVWILDYRAKGDVVLDDFSESRAVSFGFSRSSAPAFLDDIY